MSFFSRNHRPVTKVPPIGNGTAPTYEEVFDPEIGEYRLIESGSDNLFDFVQASKEESLVYNIIAKYQRGDVNALNRCVGQYMDVVGMPTNLAEAHATMLDVERKFNSLSPEIRSNFDNDINVFIDVVSHATPEQLQGYFGVTPSDVANANIDVKDGDGSVA